MEAFRQRQMVCRTTLAPTVGKEENERTLRAFHAPARGYERGDGNSGRRRTSGLVKQQAPPVTYFNPLQRILRMSSDTLTDADAERMVYPFHASAVTTPFEQVIVALIDRLEGTVNDVVWNKPETPPAWSTDLRFFGAWWLVVRSRDAKASVSVPADQHPSGRRSRVSWVQGMHGEPLLSTSTATLLKAFHEDREDQRYAPLLPPGATAAEENQLVADLARRLTGPIDHLDIFHISGLALSAERLHVLFFSGFLALAAMHDTRKGTRRLGVQTISGTSGKVSTVNVGGAAAAVAAGASATLSTLSLSSCQITSAGLLIVLTGVAALATYGMNGISTLDLSYNGLQTPSLYAFTQMLRFTFVKRLSLRGNALASVNIIPFREFLLEGCDRQVEELDLSYTELTVEQVSVLIEALPRLTRLRVLLLEEVTIPFSKLPTLVRAVERTQLWHLRLASTTGALHTLPGTAAPAFSSATTTASASTAAAVASYMKAIEEVCARNARHDVEANGSTVASASHGGFFGMNTSSFFEAFFRLSELKRSGLGGDASALPSGYGAFTGNDPSLR